MKIAENITELIDNTPNMIEEKLESLEGIFEITGECYNSTFRRDLQGCRSGSINEVLSQ
jgi:hypothetical protein